MTSRGALESDFKCGEEMLESERIRIKVVEPVPVSSFRTCFCVTSAAHLHHHHHHHHHVIRLLGVCGPPPLPLTSAGPSASRALRLLLRLGHFLLFLRLDPD